MLAKSFNWILVISTICLARGLFLWVLWVQLTRGCILISWELLAVSSLNLEIPFLLDFFSLIFIFSVTVIFGSVMLFSKSYMQKEIYFLRFHLIVLFFVFSMSLLIFSPNLISILLGWDGLGVTSYLLVIYFYRAKSGNAGILTALTNRVGDCLILLSIGLSLKLYSWNFSVVRIEVINIDLTILILLTLAACTKRAQIPFSAWLPAAISAPTPVSALVHSSTLVTAGVYLVIRLNNQLQISGVSRGLLFIGSITILMAGASAIFEIDMKKIVALSTLSQLGLIIRALGLGAFKIAFFHLVTHAYFKALLFIGVGNLIHQADRFQDLRKIYISAPILPSTFGFIIIANFRLCGIPFMAGFFSKDSILETRLRRGLAPVAIVIFFFATALTAAYTFRFFIIICSGPRRRGAFRWLSEKDKEIFLSIICLRLLGVIGGAILLPFFDFYRCLYLPLELKNLTLSVVVAGARFGAVMYKQQKHSGLRHRAGSMWALPFLSSSLSAPAGLYPGFYISALREVQWVNTTLESRFAEIKAFKRYSGLPLIGFFREASLGFVVVLMICLIYLHFLTRIKSSNIKSLRANT